MVPLIIINFKAYKEAIGANGLKLAKVCDEVAKQKKSRIMVAVQSPDIYPISHSVRIPVLAQHVDYQYGKFTGYVSAKCIKENGAYGTLLNHAEHKLEYAVLKNTIKECKRIGLKTVVCAKDLKEARQIAHLSPDYIAYEVPELIGTLQSISKLKPISVRRFSNIVKAINPKIVPLCGAGIANREDVMSALDLGTKGVLIATAVVKAKKPKKALLNLIT